MRIPIVVFLLTVRAYAAITGPVTAITAKASGSNPALSGSVNTGSAGITLLVVTLAGFSSSTSLATVSDAKGNNWHHATDRVIGTLHAGIWYAFDSGSGQPLVVGSGETVTVIGNYPSYEFTSWAGTLAGVNPFDQENGGSSSASTLVVPIINPSVSKCLVVTALSASPGITYTISSPFAVSNSVDYVASNWMGSASGYVIQTSTIAAGPTWTMSTGGSMVAGIVSFKPGASVTVAPRHREIWSSMFPFWLAPWNILREAFSV
jgi:hypothetical protein